MRQVQYSRQQFIGWLAQQSGERKDLPELPMEHFGSPNQIIDLVWTNWDENETPLIAVSSDEMREFLAFVSTYVGTFVPFTAFFRVVPREFLYALPSAPEHVDESVLKGFLGAIVCDTVLQLGGAARPSDISVQACLAVPSAVAAKAALVGYDGDLCNLILQRYFSLRDELSSGQLKIQPKEYQHFWATVLAVFSERPAASNGVLDPRSMEFVRSAKFEQIERGDRNWNLIQEYLPGMSHLGYALQGNREERVRALEELLSNSARFANSSVPIEMLLGYITAKVAEGSLNYIPLAYRMADRFPSAILWYGLFSGLNKNSDILTAGECLGRRVSRYIRPASRGLGPVTADMSYEEFILFLRENRLSKIRTDHSSVIEIELMPGVTARYRLSRPNKVSDEPRRQADALDLLRRAIGQLQSTLRVAEAEAAAGHAVGPLFNNEPSNRSAPNKSKHGARRKSTK